MTDGEPSPRYTFGDTAVAAERLHLLAWVFDAPSRAFLSTSVDTPPRVALDLGCGPGATTHLVADTTGAEHTVGLDTSAAFLELARANARPGITFELHDATEMPLPYAPADVIYCRLLLAHLADVAATVTELTSQLRPGGRLLLDELEWIVSDHPVFVRYERVVVDLVASRGAPMYAGPIIDTLRRGSGWRRHTSVVQVVPVATSDAARMFGMNLETWRDDPHIRTTHDTEEIDRLGRDLDALRSSTAHDEITWGLRQAVYQRNG